MEFARPIPLFSSNFHVQKWFCFVLTEFSSHLILDRREFHVELININYLNFVRFDFIVDHHEFQVEIISITLFQKIFELKKKQNWFQLINWLIVDSLFHFAIFERSSKINGRSLIFRDNYLFENKKSKPIN